MENIQEAELLDSAAPAIVVDEHDEFVGVEDSVVKEDK